MTNQKKYDAPLSTLISCRVRLSEVQREKLKSEYNKIRQGKKPSEQEPLAIGSSIAVTTAIDYMAEFYQQLGMNAVVIADLLGSRDSISLPLILKLQHALGVNVIPQKQVLDAAKGYVQYVWDEYCPK